MRFFRRILIFHPGAIGDVMLATPVVHVLRSVMPEAYIMHCCDQSLHELIQATGTVNEVISFNKAEGLIALRARLLKLKPDLIVDLAGSVKSNLMFWLAPATVLHYRKQSPTAKPVVHAVDNFLDTLKPLKLDDTADITGLNKRRGDTTDISRRGDAMHRPHFPTIKTLDEHWLSNQQFKTQNLIALVPGVGKFRAHRAWPLDRWEELIIQLRKKGIESILIGGTDDISVSNELVSRTNIQSLVGKLSLLETATLLSQCRLAVSGDTGPAHLAVAVGTKVVGLYGPTLAARSGPYGCAELTIDRSNSCQCLGYKACQLLVAEPNTKSTSNQQSGLCMQQISVEEVLFNLGACPGGAGVSPAC